jgi:hypothetical protein
LHYLCFVFHALIELNKCIWFAVVTTQMENYILELQLISWDETLLSSEHLDITTQLGQSNTIPGGSTVGGVCKTTGTQCVSALSL